MPTGPAPLTITRPSAGSGVRATACTATENGSSSTACRHGRSAGSGTRLSARTVTYSAAPPSFDRPITVRSGHSGRRPAAHRSHARQPSIEMTPTWVSAGTGPAPPATTPVISCPRVTGVDTHS